MKTVKKRRSRTVTKKKRTQELEKVRLAIECTPKERKYIKMFAALEDKTLNEFVLECVRMRLYECLNHHTPNKETVAAMRAAESGKGVFHFDSVEDFFKEIEK
jgi:uncharacterized protein (DUF1778 family)